MLQCIWKIPFCAPSKENQWLTLFIPSPNIRTLIWRVKSCFFKNLTCKVVFMKYVILIFQKTERNLFHVKAVRHIDFCQEPTKIWQLWKRYRYLYQVLCIFIKRLPKLTNCKRVPPMYFYKKSWFFVRGAPRGAPHLPKTAIEGRPSKIAYIL